MIEPKPGTVESVNVATRRFVEAAGCGVTVHPRGSRRTCTFCRRWTRQQITDGPNFCNAHAGAAIVAHRYRTPSPQREEQPR